LGDTNYAGSSSAPQALSVHGVAPPGGGQTGGGATTPVGGPNAGQGAGVLANQSVGVSATQIAAGLAAQLLPHGKGAKIASLLKSGGLALRFTALEAGTAEIDWYQVPAGAKVAK